MRGRRVQGPLLDAYPAPVDHAHRSGSATPGSPASWGVDDRRRFRDRDPDASRIHESRLTPSDGRRGRRSGSVTRSRRSASTSAARSISIEEVARHHGYDRLPATFPALVRPPAAAATVPAPPPGRCDSVLTALGCTEAITYSFIERRAALPFVSDEQRARGHRQPAVGEVHGAASVARPGPARLGGPEPPPGATRRPAVRDRQAVYPRGEGERPALAVMLTGAGTGQALERSRAAGRPLRHEGRRGGGRATQSASRCPAPWRPTSAVLVEGPRGADHRGRCVPTRRRSVC